MWIFGTVTDEYVMYTEQEIELEVDRREKNWKFYRERGVLEMVPIGINIW